MIGSFRLAQPLVRFISRTEDVAPLGMEVHVALTVWTVYGFQYSSANAAILSGISDVTAGASTSARDDLLNPHMLQAQLQALARTAKTSQKRVVIRRLRSRPSRPSCWRMDPVLVRILAKYGRLEEGVVIVEPCVAIVADLEVSPVVVGPMEAWGAPPAALAYMDAFP